MKLIITNTTNKQQTVKLLSALYSDLSYIPKGVNISLLSDNYNDYSDLLNSIRMDPIIIKFLHSSNNRQLFFLESICGWKSKIIRTRFRNRLNTQIGKKRKENNTRRWRRNI